MSSPKPLANRAQRLRYRYQMLTHENESSDLHLTCRENRMSDASSILKILPVKGVLFSTSVEVRVLIVRNEIPARPLPLFLENRA